MSSPISVMTEDLAVTRHKWLVTGAAGFIGSHLVETLLAGGQDVVGLDDFSTGRMSNLEEVRAQVGPAAWTRYVLLEGDIQDPAVCMQACEGVDYVLHHAAFVSVPLSMEKPDRTTWINVGGFANLLACAQKAEVRRVVYASSSAVYGDASGPANRETRIGEPLSPYALSKQQNEMQGRLYSRSFGLSTVGLRYFNVFGPRQNAAGGYAAVIPLWLEATLRGEPCRIYGDGTATRDYCYVKDIVQANLLAALTPLAKEHDGAAFNIGVSRPVSLLELHSTLREAIAEGAPGRAMLAPVREPMRPGDILHSTADVGSAGKILGFHASYSLRAGLDEILHWRNSG